MKHLLVFLFALPIYCDYLAQNTSEMNYEALEQFTRSDKQLNAIYKTILEEYKQDTVFIQNLKKSQRIWIQFRDAEMMMKYPDFNESDYGSISSTCKTLYLKKLTENRITTLIEWIEGIEEGEVCRGSVKIYREIEPQYMGKAYITADSSIGLTANMKKDYRIFGYKKADIFSEKLIVLSIFTNDVKGNPYGCKYGSFYETSKMKEINLQYQSTENDFIKAAIRKNGKTIDKVYMLKKWFEFEEE